MSISSQITRINDTIESQSKNDPCFLEPYQFEVLINYGVWYFKNQHALFDYCILLASNFASLHESAFHSRVNDILINNAKKLRDENLKKQQ